MLKLKHSVTRENDDEIKKLKQQIEELQQQLAKYASLFNTTTNP